MCTISGSQLGRSFAAKIFFTASASNAFAPNPYTVSVGNATVPPARRIFAASAMARREVSLSRSAALTLSLSVSIPKP